MAPHRLRRMKGGTDLGEIRGDLRASAHAFVDSFRSARLARVQMAFIAFNLMEWAAYIAISVYAFDKGGIRALGLLSLLQLIPAALIAPVGSVLGDRYPRDRVLVAAYASLATMTGLTAIAMLADAPAPFVYIVGSMASWLVSIVRPIHGAILPWVARTPQELSVAYAASSVIESASIFLGPLVAGALLLLGARWSLSGPGLVDAALAALLIIATILVAGAVVRRVDGEAVASSASEHWLQEFSEGFRTVWREPRPRMVLGFIGAGWFTLGVVETTMVYLAFRVLGTGEAGVGFLNAALGSGALVGASAAVVVATRRRTFPAFRAGIMLEGLPLIALAASPLLAVPVLAAVGAGNQITDATGTIMLQRLIPDRKLSRVLGVLESVFTAPEGVGGFAGALLISSFGLGWTLLGIGLFTPTIGFLARRRIAALDVGMRLPEHEIALLKRTPVFGPLPPTVLERLAGNAVPLDVDTGTVIIRQGDRGDRFYVLEHGEVEVVKDGRSVGRLVDGDSVGEIALLRDVPRTATVTSTRRSRLLVIERQDFLLALSGHPDAGRAAHAMAEERLQHGTSDEPA
jgi:MFS family permease